MVRISAIFIAVCMVLIAGCLGVVLYLVLGLSAAEAAIVALTALTGLALYNTVAGRVRDREDVGQQIADLSRGTADIARQVAEIDRRLVQMESAVSTVVDKTRAITDPLGVELNELGGLMKRLAESVAAHEQVLTGNTAAPLAPAMLAAAARSADTATTIDTTELGEPEAQRMTSGRFKGMQHSEIIALIREAVDASRVDLYLQPTVTLPQRKVRFYEAMTRLRTAEGEILQPVDYLGYAESGGLMPAIDNLCVLRCVQVVRRLLAKSREVGLFCNVAASTLVDSRFFPQLSDFMQANRAIGPSIVLEFAQATVRAMGPMENESLAALANLGFSFSMDRVTDLRIEPRDLADRGFRYVKIPAALLLNRMPANATDIHPADFSDMLGRCGIDLIAEKIESEGTVVDLLDYDVRYGQGFLFSPPRPVRVEVLQGIGDRNDIIDRKADGGPEAQEGPRPGAPAPRRSLTDLLRGSAPPQG